MELELNKDYVNSCNNVSQFNAGDNIVNSANADYQEFITHFNSDNFNNEQKTIYEKRLKAYKEFLENSYNDLLRLRSNFVPVNVAGPAKYNQNQAIKRMKSIDNKSQEIAEKKEKFFANTDKMLIGAYTKDEILNKIRNGYETIISNDDPLAIDKLNAKLEFLETRHQKYLDFNKEARKNKNQQLDGYVLSNSKQNINGVKDRIKEIEKLNSLNDCGYYFQNGEIDFDKKDMRVKIYFDEIPSEEIRNNLKSHGFKWSPKNKAWQRKLTTNAIYTTKRLFKDIGSLEIKKVNDMEFKI